MPPYNAMEEVLPEHRYIDNNPSSSHPKCCHPNSNQHYHPVNNSGRFDTEHKTFSVVDQQMTVADDYRGAVARMRQDILALRSTVRDLEVSNSRLRLQLQDYGDTTKIIIDTTKIDGLPRNELASRYASIKQKLTSQSSELQSYKDKVQKLQNELIRKNDKMKDYLKMSHAHASQQNVLHRLQEKVQKVRRLEDTCHKQEKVIESMEGILEKRKDKYIGEKDTISQANAALLEENKRLRHQVDDMREQLLKADKAGTDDMEKLELYQALERAEGRVMSLEKQLSENSRQWGRERAEFQIRSSEKDYGFGRSSGLLPRDYPALRY